MTTTQPLLRRTLAVATALALAPPTLAQQPQTPGAATLDQVVVTGTRARDRTVLNSPVPVDIITREDLQRTGSVNNELGQALQTLLPSFNFPRQSNSGNADHIRSAQLRGMSPDQVLVLVNGKRRHTTSVVFQESKIAKGTSPVDFNTIPISAVKRIEVLRDGAGAQYGSDAIAGVINIILDDSAGGAASVTYGLHHTDFGPTNQTITDGHNVAADLSYGWNFGDSGFLRLGAEYKDRGFTNRAGFDTLPFFEEQTPDNQALIGQRNFRPGDPAVEDVLIWFNAEHAVGSSAEAYAFATYNDRESVGAAFFRYPDSSANVKSIFPNGFRPETLGDLSDFSGAFGVRGFFGEWGYDASITYGNNELETGLQRSLNASLGEASPTDFRLGDFEFEQITFNADVVREYALDGLFGPLTLAAGVEFRDEGFETTAGDEASIALGPVPGAPGGAQAGPGLRPEDAVDISRQVRAIYGELSAEFTEQLFANVAARYEDYSDFGDTFNAKGSLRYEFAPGWAIRGAGSTNFRAPSLSQVGFSRTTTSFGDGQELTRVQLIPSTSVIGQALGLEPLENETANSWSIGLTSAPAPGLTASLDFFRITVDDRITLSERFQSDALTDFIESGTGLPGVVAVNFFTNAVDTKTRGAELVIAYERPLADGTLRLTGAATYNKTSIRNIRATPQTLQSLGLSPELVGVEERNTLTTASPRHRQIISATWTNPRWTFLTRLTQHGSVERIFNFGGGFEPQQRNGNELQLDLEGSYRPVERLSLTLGASNITDNLPDPSTDDINFFGNLPFDIISPIGSNGAYYYARVSLSF
jgi:iron complex outermembrane receptor protein